MIEGASVATFDLDIVHERGVKNVERLMAALEALAARYRERPDLSPTAAALRGAGHHLLMTRCGPLDVRGIIGKERDYRSLAPPCRRRSVGGTSVRVLDLAAQIAIKEELGFAEDRAALPLLRAALAERRRK